MTGVLIIDKPRGITSHDVVSKVKKKLNASKVGHLGTLDPNATGVLPLVIDGATKFARFLEGGKKCYDAEMTLGVTTDTFDSEGEVLATIPVDDVTEEMITDVLAGFTGKINQLPPMYSAVKRNGTPLYKLARKGLTIERESKEVEIYSIEVKTIEMPKVVFSVSCSRGTYIRTLCEDAGEKLKVGAHLSALKRTESGGFNISEARDIEASRDELIAAIIPLGDALATLNNSLDVDIETSEKIARGDTLLGITGCQEVKAGETVILTRGAMLLALALYKGDGIFKVEKVLSAVRTRESEKISANQ